MEIDFIRTPKEITKALLRYESFDGNILEPCCGDGAISEILKKNNYNVTSSDKFDYNYGNIKDLFQISELQANIITNPPFTGQQMVKKHLLSITRKKLALLWYVKNIGNEVETKTSKYLKNIYVFNQKIPWIGIKFGWLFAWYIWDKNHKGDILIKRINY